ncbi:germin-like protein subfamily 1 member 11 [Salvia miltiorrhiza]|uniref:germin-like protein subfamily 1 member 11 n=1 Tax=Salvia miltiorrhiza TaxID=226208 RepID=UPI0025AD6FE3|nr:germin-like protein subfamily 1 member 11 [Salvia miltiorrhiza]
MKSWSVVLLLISTVSLFSFLASAADPDPVQDFCVSVNDTKFAVFVNGKFCKKPESVTADDFYYAAGLHEPQPITSPFGSKITMAFERQFPALNTQGVAMSRIDFAPQGLNPPHWHPRASEMLVVLQGTLYSGFFTTNPHDPHENGTLYAKTLRPGDVFVFPRGLLHFQYNVGHDHAVAFVSFNSQNPGVVTAARLLFGAEPWVCPRMLADAFQIDVRMVAYLQSLRWEGNN